MKKKSERSFDRYKDNAISVLASVEMDSDRQRRIQQLARRYLRQRPRSKREVKEYLRKKQCPAPDSERIIDDLVSEGHLNDRSFAKLWIDDRLNHHPRSRSLIQKELLSKGLTEDLIDEVFKRDFSGYDEPLKMRQLGEEYLRKKNNEPTEKKKQSTYRFLLQRGYDKDLISDFIENTLS